MLTMHDNASLLRSCLLTMLRFGMDVVREMEKRGSRLTLAFIYRSLRIEYVDRLHYIYMFLRV